MKDSPRLRAQEVVLGKHEEVPDLVLEMCRCSVWWVLFVLSKGADDADCRVLWVAEE